MKPPLATIKHITVGVLVLGTVLARAPVLTYADTFPPTTKFVGVPSFIAAPSGYVGALITGANGHVYELYYQNDDPNWGWTDHEMPLPTRANACPSAVATASGDIDVFVSGWDDGHVYELPFFHSLGWRSWMDRGSPGGVGTTNAPNAVVAPSGYLGVLIAATNGHVYELYQDESTQDGSGWSWTDHGLPPGSRPASGAAAVAAPSGYVGAMLLGTNGHVYELYYQNEGPDWGWTGHGLQS